MSNNNGGQQWAKVPAWVAGVDLDATALRAYIVIAAKAGKDRVAWIGAKAVGEKIEKSERTARKAIGRLLSAGVLERDGRHFIPGKRGAWSWRYRVVDVRLTDGPAEGPMVEATDGPAATTDGPVATTIGTEPCLERRDSVPSVQSPSSVSDRGLRANQGVSTSRVRMFKCSNDACGHSWDDQRFGMRMTSTLCPKCRAALAYYVPEEVQT